MASLASRTYLYEQEGVALMAAVMVALNLPRSGTSYWRRPSTARRGAPTTNFHLGNDT